jgi:hypothetical protein
VLEARQAVLLISPNAVAALAGVLASGASAPPLVLAVGSTTANPLRRAGLARVEAAPGSDAVDLLRLARAHLGPCGGPVAYLSRRPLAPPPLLRGLDPPAISGGRCRTPSDLDSGHQRASNAAAENHTVKLPRARRPAS